MEQFQPVLDRLVSELGAAVTFLCMGVRCLARYAGRSKKMRSTLFSVVLSVVATLVCGNVSAQPAAVTNFTAQGGDQRVTLSWVKPAGVITYYQYRQSTDGGATWSDSDWAYIYVNGDTTPHTATVTELTNGTAYTFQVRAVSAAGNGAESASETATPELLTMTISLSSEDISSTLDDTIGISFRGGEIQVVVTGGREPYKYILVPPSFQRIEIDSTSGLIQVAPNTIGYFDITARVEDSADQTEFHDFTLHVSVRPLGITPIGPKAAWDGRAITPFEVTVYGGLGPYTYRLDDGPSGISIDSSSGQITGTPTEESGFFTVTVTVTDSVRRTAKRDFNMNVYSTRLAEKFKPILVLDSRDNDQRPKQVEILGAHVGQDSSGRDLWKSIYYEVTNRREVSLGEVRATEIAAYRIDGVRVDSVPGVDTTTANFSMLRNHYVIRNKKLYPHFDFGGPGVDGSGHDGGTLPTWESVYTDHKDGYGDRIYAHIFKEDDKTVIQYWFFYPYNDWWNNHEGDWEHINVVVSSPDPRQAVAEAVEYYFHHDYIRRVVVEPGASGTSDNPLIGLQGLEGVDNSVALIKGRRPVVYVGGWGEWQGGSGPGGHGSYPCHGPWRFVRDYGALVATLYDSPDGKGSILYDVPLTVLGNASEYDYDVNPEMSWLKANLRFGHRYGDGPYLATLKDGHAAPEGPAYKETWRRTGMAGMDEYTFVPLTRTDFQHHFIKENTSWSGDVLLIGDIIIDPGVTLTIAPGTTIRSSLNQDIHSMNDAARVDIVNHGEITADASEGDSIVFRSNASVPSPGDWYGIRNYGKLTMKNCVIRDSRGSVEGYDRQTSENVRFVNNSPLTVLPISKVVATRKVAIDSIQVSALGGAPPYTYSVSGQPSGISISELTGLITGTPTVEGDSTFTVTVTVRDTGETGSTPTTVQKPFTMSVAYSPLRISEILDVEVTPDESFSRQVSAQGGVGKYQYSMSSDDLDSGEVSIDSDSRLITGTPVETRSYPYSVTVTDEDGRTDSTSFTLTVSGPSQKPALPQLTISPPTIPRVEATQGVAITPIQVSATGGRTPYAYSLSGSPDKNRIEISEGGGLITGTPGQTGTYSFKVKVTDGDSRADSTSFTMRVSPPLTISPQTIPRVEATQGVAITPIQVSASGGRGSYTYSLSGSPNENGIEISESGGLITGTPAQTGTYSFKVKVTDRDSRADSTSFTMRVFSLEPPPISNFEATRNVAITPIPLNASGGRGAYRYSLSGSPSKNGIAISGNSIRGTPGQTGSYTYTVTVRDEDDRTASMSFRVRVSPRLDPPSIRNVEATRNVAITPIQANASGGRGSYTYSPLSGAPPGISITSSGRITGAPAQTGSYIVAVTVRDEDDRTASMSFRVRVSSRLRISEISDVVMDLGESISIRVSASGGRGSYRYSLSGNPSGVSLSGSSITVMPTQAGTPRVTVTATDEDGRTDSESFTISVAPELNVASISDVVMDLGERVTVPVSVSGGRRPYRYSLSGNPSGVSLSGSSITVMPTQAGTPRVTVTVTDRDGRSDSESFTVSVAPELDVAEISDVVMDQGESISIQVSASGGRTPYRYSLSGNPSSISMSGSSITGTPTQVGTSRITVTVTDVDGRSDETSFDVEVSAPIPPLTVSSISDVTDATRGVAITSIQVTAQGGRTPYTYSLSGQPSGISISSSGLITGAPTQVGTSRITVTVRDDDNRTASTSFDMRVSPPLEISPQTISDVEATKGVAIADIQVSASGGRGAYRYSLSGAPGGISISSSGLITGTTTQTGSFTTFKAKVTDADGRTASTLPFTMRVSPPLTVSSISDVEDATRNVAITSIQVAAQGGRTPYSYSLSGNPGGISMSGSGLITGTPTATGIFPLTATVTDRDGRTASAPFLVDVAAPLTVSSIGNVSATQNRSITSIQVSASGGEPSYRYSLSGNPGGISISNSGLITGASTQAGSFTVKATVTDAGGRTASASFTMSVAAPLAVSSISEIEAYINVAITSVQVSASGGKPSYGYSMSGQPSGISISSSGLITGTPTERGWFDVTVTVTDRDGTTASTSFNIDVL